MADKKYLEFEPVSCLGPPELPGVYGVFEYLGDNETCLYIGSSRNIRKRVMFRNHPYIKLFNEGRFVCTRSIITTDYLELERELIRKYQPEFNVTLYKNG